MEVLERGVQGLGLQAEEDAKRQAQVETRMNSTENTMQEILHHINEKQRDLLAIR